LSACPEYEEIETNSISVWSRNLLKIVTWREENRWEVNITSKTDLDGRDDDDDDDVKWLK
jgi:hypothetical protein